MAGHPIEIKTFYRWPTRWVRVECPELVEGQHCQPKDFNGGFPRLGISSNVNATQDGAMYFVYILECNDGSFYIGHTEDVEARLQVHQSGREPTHTASRLPLRLAHSEKHETLADAVRRERQLKRWTRAKKLALIAKDMETLKVLSKSKMASAK